MRSCSSNVAVKREFVVLVSCVCRTKTTASFAVTHHSDTFHRHTIPYLTPVMTCQSLTIVSLPSLLHTHTQTHTTRAATTRYPIVQLYQIPRYRVRTILVLGYWVLGNIHRYWIVLLLGAIFCCSDTQYNTNQTAVSTIHMPVDDYLVLVLTCTLTAAIVCLICYCLLNTIIVIMIEFWDFSWSLLCYILVSVLVLGIGIARGQYYWVLDIGCLSWYHSNPT